MRKLSRKVCLLFAGASLGWAWATPVSAASLIEKADVVFAEGDNDVSLELVDYNKKLARQRERECKAAEREQAKMYRDQEKCREKACKEQEKMARQGDKACRGGGGMGGAWDNTCNLFGDAGSCFTEELGDPWTVNSLLWDECDEPCFNIGGWVQVGYHNDNDGTFNTRPDKFNLHQSWLYIEKVADGSDGIGFGGRIDTVYGQDGPNTQAFGNDFGRYDFSDDFNYGAQYGWAIPQAYGQIAYENFSVKIGHFFTLQGYEVVAATGNFFYSHALSMNFIEPFTHTGAVATYTVSEDVEVYGGWVAGWDSGFDRFNGASAWHGGVKLGLMDNMSLIYTSTAGNLGWIGDGYSQSVIVTSNLLLDELTNVVGGDYVRTNQGVYPAGAPSGDTFHALSLYNYMIYAINDRTGVGMRNEWTKVDGVSYNSFTVGLNYKPMANVVVRPEYRYNYSPAGDNMPAGGRNPLGISVNESILGVDAIVTF
jgi:hypothetical protein